MSLLEPLAVTALLGTRKQAMAPLAVEGPIGPLLDAIARDPASDEARLLRSAAVLDMCQHAGWLAPEATTRRRQRRPRKTPWPCRPSKASVCSTRCLPKATHALAN